MGDLPCVVIVAAAAVDVDAASRLALFFGCRFDFTGRPHASAEAIWAQLHGSSTVPTAQVRLSPTNTARVVAAGATCLFMYFVLWPGDGYDVYL